MDEVLDIVVSTMQTELTNVASKAGIAIAAIIGIGLSIFAVKWLIGVIKDFFQMLTSSGDYYADDDSDADYDYDINDI